MQVSTAGGVKVYNLSAGKSLPEWISERKRRSLLKNDVGTAQFTNSRFSRFVNLGSSVTQTCVGASSCSKTSPCPSPPPAYECPRTANTSWLQVSVSLCVRIPCPEPACVS